MTLLLMFQQQQLAFSVVKYIYSLFFLLFFYVAFNVNLFHFMVFSKLFHLYISLLFDIF